MSIGQRIIQARKGAELSQEALSALMGLTRTSCSQWERGITSPSLSNLSILAIELEVSFEWLATGRGKMEYMDQPPLIKDSYPSYIATNKTINPKIAELVSGFQELPPYLQQTLQILIKQQVRAIKHKGKTKS